jgi:hypothetical protein
MWGDANLKALKKQWSLRICENELRNIQNQAYVRITVTTCNYSCDVFVRLKRLERVLFMFGEGRSTWLLWASFPLSGDTNTLEHFFLKSRPFCVSDYNSGGLLKTCRSNYKLKRWFYRTYVIFNLSKPVQVLRKTEWNELHSASAQKWSFNVPRVSCNFRVSNVLTVYFHNHNFAKRNIYYTHLLKTPFLTRSILWGAVSARRANITA